MLAQYHNLQHRLIYNSFDCNTKLIRHIFSDSKVGSKLFCGRTKAEALVTTLLAHSSVKDFLQNL